MITGKADPAQEGAIFRLETFAWYLISLINDEGFKDNMREYLQYHIKEINSQFGLNLPEGKHTNV